LVAYLKEPEPVVGTVPGSWRRSVLSVFSGAGVGSTVSLSDGEGAAGEETAGEETASDGESVTAGLAHVGVDDGAERPRLLTANPVVTSRTIKKASSHRRRRPDTFTVIIRTDSHIKQLSVRAEAP
jgi:hypothetical protein